MINIGIVGCGTIGSEICKAIDQGIVSASLIGVCDIEPIVAHRLSESLRNKTPVMNQTDLIQAADLVVEATCKKAAPGVIRETLQKRRNIIVMSVGGLLGHMDEFRALSHEQKCYIYVPSGAIAGIDSVKAAREAEIFKATLTTRKPPRGLAGAPYIIENNIDLNHLTEATLIFSGTATEAVPAFPANINVAAALSFAGVGPDRTMVNIIADPNCDRNTHEVEIEGDFGRIITRTELRAAPQNPKTSLLASLSAIALLRRITSFVVVGT